MVQRIRKYITPNMKERLLNFLPYRIYSRFALNSNEIRFSCELTTKCNLRCKMCTRSLSVQPEKFYKNEMNKEMVDCIVNEIQKFYKNGNLVTFAPMGLGEPLLFKGLFDLFCRIKNISKTIRIVLVTNGILLDKTCAEKLISLEIDEVSISLNTTNSESYRNYMGINYYDKICYNTKQLIKLRNESGKRFPRVFIQYLDFDNDREIFQEEIRQWSKIMEYGDKCYVHPIVNQAGFFSGGSNFKMLERTYPCATPLFVFGIKVHGDIYPCDAAFYAGDNKVQSLYLGNLRDQSPYELFRNRNSLRYKILEDMKKDDYSKLPECKRCNVYKLGGNRFFGLPSFLRFKGYRWL